MILGIAEDFSSDVALDSQLKAVPSSGLYLNTGVHPSVNVGNLIDFLPKLNFTFAAWSNSTAYNVFLTSRNRSDIVTHNSKTWQCIQAHTNQTPAEGAYWTETNIDSLRLKIFIESVKDRVLTDLNLNKKLVNNQFIYEEGDTLKTLPSDFAAFVIEPKGSDYVSFRINQISIQADGVTPINVYVVNNGTILKTVAVTPANGKLNFQDVDITLSGKGKFYLAIDNQDVYIKGGTLLPHKYDGFVIYSATGTGATADVADWSYNSLGFGMGINISAYLDASQYVSNNLLDFGNFIRAAFEYMVFQMFHANPNNRSNRSERIQMSEELLLAELKSADGDTVLKRYYKQRSKAQSMLQKTFDTQLKKKSNAVRIRV